MSDIVLTLMLQLDDVGSNGAYTNEQKRAIAEKMAEKICDFSGADIVDLEILPSE